ncbi:hypothetical protein HDU92_003519 [Lobulomyces angularis]|nr:hypothetical protein HDU92_003519 [Lobulomyces angularis]
MHDDEEMDVEKMAEFFNFDVYQKKNVTNNDDEDDDDKEEENLEAEKIDAFINPQDGINTSTITEDNLFCLNTNAVDLQNSNIFFLQQQYLHPTTTPLQQQQQQQFFKQQKDFFFKHNLNPYCIDPRHLHSRKFFTSEVNRSLERIR